MMSKKPTSGKPLQLRVQGEDGEWREFNRKSNQLNIDLPGTSEIDVSYKAFLSSFAKQKCITVTGKMIEPFSAQDDLVTGVLLFGDDLQN